MGGMAKTHVAVILSAAARKKLTGWVNAHGTPQQVVKRCQIVLRDADGTSDVETAATLGLSRHTCRLWRQRFVSDGPDALWKVAPGRGRKPDGARQQRILTATLERKPKGQTHWSTRTLARDLGVSPTLVRQVWQAHQLKPHLEKTFKVSRDPLFLQKLTDVVGLYLHAPERALVLCVDEKSQIQALDRTQPGLPLKKGRCGTMTHDYKRNGTTTLFAALEVLSGKVVGQCQPRHRHQEFIRFLQTLDGEFPAPLELHLVLDNYGTHKKDKVRAWLARHPRFVLHFIPTSSSWLNLVERWFGELTRQALRRGVFLSIPDLEAAIAAYLESWNEAPRPFVWTATVESIWAKITRCRDVLEKNNPGCTLPKKRKKAAPTV
jgi:transposase